MTLKTIVPKLGDAAYYFGKPVKDTKGNRIGGITDVVESGDCYELTMEIHGIYSGETLMTKIRVGLGIDNE
jgi:hypothetical protein